MPKQKQPEKEWSGNFDRLPMRERIISRAGDRFRSIAEFYGFEPIRTSPLEDARTFSSLVRAGYMEEKPPFFCDSGEFSIALRPSGVLGIIRAYGAHKMNDLPHPLKFFFQGESFFNASRNAAYPFRVRSELGVSMIGEDGPIAEAEIIQVIWKLFEVAGIDAGNLRFQINATSCYECRPSFRTPFASYFRSKTHRLCKNCKKYLKSNPTKILSCREEQCRIMSQNAPQVLDHLCENCKRHLRGTLEFLDEMRVPYFLDPKFFKDGGIFGGLIFEIHFFPPASGKKEADIVSAEESVIAEKIKSDASIEIKAEEKEEPKAPVMMAEGGRISRAAELMAGKRLDVACGTVNVEEFINAVMKNQYSPFLLEKPKVFLAQLGELAKRKSLGLLETLRAGEFSVQESLGRDSIKSQLNVAERVGAQVALILGQKEALDKTIIVREIESGIQETIPQEKLIDFLKRKLNK